MNRFKVGDILLYPKSGHRDIVAGYENEYYDILLQKGSSHSYHTPSKYTAKVVENNWIKVGEVTKLQRILFNI